MKFVHFEQYRDGSPSYVLVNPALVGAIRPGQEQMQEPTTNLCVSGIWISVMGVVDEVKRELTGY